MPVSPNNLQFSLSSEYLDKLKSLSKDGESQGLTAKRILIEALDEFIGGDSRLTDLRLTDLESRLQQVEGNLDLVFEAIDFAEAMEEQEEPDKISQVMEAFKGVTKILSEHNSRLTDLESSVQAFIQIVKNHDSQLTDLFNETIEYGDEIKKVNDRIQAVEGAINCQHYGDEVKELRGQVDELRKLVYQLTSPVKRR